MTRDEILGMAREVGFDEADLTWLLERLERFANLVAEAERKHIASEHMDAAIKYDTLVQAITDPENQPSQYGTVTVAYMEKMIDEWVKNECTR